MTRCLLTVLSLLAAPGLWAIDGQVLLNQSTVTAAGFPYLILQPGSYKLTGNIVAPPNQVAIVIRANNVTLDLNGFNIQCSADDSLSPGFGDFMFGCVTDGTIPTRRASIVNGTFTITVSRTTSFPFIAAVSLWFSSGVTIQDLRFDSTHANPFFLRNFAIIRRNVFTGTGGPGITCPALVESNVNATNNAGISDSARCVFVNNLGIF